MSVELAYNANVDGNDANGTGRSILNAQPENILFPPNFFRPGRAISLFIRGRITTIVTNPGTLRLDVGMGDNAAGTAAIDFFFFSGTIFLNIVAKTTVPWTLELHCVCREAGAIGQTRMFGHGFFASEAVVGSPLPAVGGNGFVVLPTGEAPILGRPFDHTSTTIMSVKANSHKTVASAFQPHVQILEVLN
jgi:hypothetical protein